MTVPRALGFDEPKTIGDHRISALLGEGGQGVVYLGESPGRAPVAIKVLHARLAADPEVRRRFLREAEVAASVAAFCTARVLGTGMLGDRPYIVSEYVPGPSLDALVKRDGPRSGSGLERLAVSTLTALASIHQAGIVHRDFKPGNVILGPEGPVVIDFGIARALDHMTSHAHVAGTPAYMSPEQLTDQAVSAASDMFAWAGTMVFAATGHTPFRGAAVPAVLHAILSAEPDVSGVPEPLRSLVAACLSKDPNARPRAAHLLRDLTGQTPSGGPTIIERRPARRGRGRWPALAAVAVAAALAVTAGVLYVPRLTAAEQPVAKGFDLASFPRVDVDDRFAEDTSGRYAAYQPHSGEAVPAIKAGQGTYAATGTTPYFGLVAGPGALPPSGAAVSVLTAGAFAGSGQFEDSLFVGWVKNGESYVTAWYNHTRKESGLEVRVDGAFVSTPGSSPLTLKPGDRFALQLSGDRITSYAESGGTWRRLGTAAIGDVLGTPQARQQYRYGFGLRGSTGTIGIARTEGRSAQE
ncbi:serine/threonine-protein kinase [Nonomuraea rhizosphaerae]|uniref:serine/threonine-protein kinase n=1 Tax=Nonomuraea rhizosphaerae TaxID=2665663 RepID=UPI001C5FCB68|nr:serine/threonine-protein kinase [Nonomuraea rhizosphaerae]